MVWVTTVAVTAAVVLIGRCNRRHCCRRRHHFSDLIAVCARDLRAVAAATAAVAVDVVIAALLPYTYVKIVTAAPAQTDGERKGGHRGLILN